MELKREMVLLGLKKAEKAIKHENAKNEKAKEAAKAQAEHEMRVFEMWQKMYAQNKNMKKHKVKEQEQKKLKRKRQAELNIISAQQQMNRITKINRGMFPTNISHQEVGTLMISFFHSF